MYFFQYTGKLRSIVKYIVNVGQVSILKPETVCSFEELKTVSKCCVFFFLFSLFREILLDT